MDFSAEMERTLSVLDCAVLVISGSDGIQGHTRTLWQLLARYAIPTFLFVNKMDLAGADREALPLEEDVLLLETDGPDKELDKKETARIINGALAQLDRPQRELFVRHYYYGQTVQEAAQAMGLNQSTAKTWLRRGRETLKAILEQEGYGHEAVGDFQTDGRVHG